MDLGERGTLAQTYVPTWRIIVAFVLDLITAFVVFGWLVAKLFGGMIETGCKQDGWPALHSIALIIAYFIVGSRTGGTLWARLLGAVRNR